MVDSIKNTYIWSKPKAKSNIGCIIKAVGRIDNQPKVNVIIAAIATPLIIFPNKRSPIDNGVVNSLIMFIGKKSGVSHLTGPKKPINLSLIPWHLIAEIWIIKKVIIDNVKAKNTLPRGGVSPNKLMVFARPKKAQTANKYGAKKRHLSPK